MLEAGLPLTTTMEGLEASPDLNQSELAKSIYKDLQAGTRLSAAFAKFPELFDSVFVGTIYMAEDSGTLVKAVRSLTNQIIQQDRTRKDLIKSLTYPFVQLMVTIFMLGFLLYYMLPKFMPFFVATGRELPWLTQLVVDLSESLVLKLLPFLVCLMGAVAIRAWRNHQFRARLIRYAYYVPLLGRVLYKQSLTSCCQQLALQLDTGLLFDFALRATARCTPFPPLERMFLRFRRRVRDGDALEEIVDGESLLPSILVDCFIIGEETGRMSQMLLLGADVLSNEVEVKRDALLQLLEPILLLIMGIAVGIVVLACFLPVYDLAVAKL